MFQYARVLFTLIVFAVTLKHQYSYEQLFRGGIIWRVQVFKMSEKSILDYLSRLEVSKERQEEIINLLPSRFKEEIKENEVENAFTRLKFFYIAQHVRAHRGIR